MYNVKKLLNNYGQRFIGISISVSLAKWVILSGIVGVLTGSAAALFMKSLDLATKTRINNPWLLYFLPIAGDW